MPPDDDPPADSDQPDEAISDFARELGKRVREAREAKKPRKWSQERLGRRSRVHWTYIGEIERGKVNASALSLARLAHALNIDLGQLMTGLPEPPPGKDPDADDE